MAPGRRGVETDTKLQAAIDALDACFAQKPLDQREKLTRVLMQARAEATETSRRLILAQSEHAHLVELQESAEARVAQAKTALEAVQRAQEHAQKREEEGHLKRARAVKAQKSAKARFHWGYTALRWLPAEASPE